MLDFFVYGRIQMYDVSRLSLCYAWLSMFTFVFTQAASSSSRATSSLAFMPQRSRRVPSVLDTRGSEDEDEVQLGASNAARALLAALEVERGEDAAGGADRDELIEEKLRARGLPSSTIRQVTAVLDELEGCK